MTPQVAAILLLVACAAPAPAEVSTTSRPEAADTEAPANTPGKPDARAPETPVPGTPVAPVAAADETTTIKIATFNIQVFGRTKAGKPEIMAQLVEIIRKYPVIAIQEIKDSTGQAPQALLDAVNNESGDKYAILLSPRTGLEPNDKSSQEQYAVLYDTQVVEALPGDRLFDDAAHDLFQREPYLTHLKVKSGGFTFVLIGIHTRPESAVEEIGSLDDVFTWAQTVFPDEGDFIALGDYNAGCSYASPAQLDALDLRGSNYFWIVPDTSDSNVSPNSACAYDRIVTTTATKDEFTGNWGVDQAFTDKAVSDHWPVWAEFRTGANGAPVANGAAPMRAPPREAAAPAAPSPIPLPVTASAARPRLSDAAIKKLLIQESMDAYSGACPCPYNEMANGRSCGKRSAYVLPGGEAPLCYSKDVTKEMVEQYRQEHTHL